jgi:hypothetical protein
MIARALSRLGEIAAVTAKMRRRSQQIPAAVIFRADENVVLDRQRHEGIGELKGPGDSAAGAPMHRKAPDIGSVKIHRARRWSGRAGDQVE